MNKPYVSIINLALIILLTSSLLLGCDNNEKSISTELWIEDIDYLAEELPKRHVDFDLITDEDEFYRKIEALKKDVPKLNDDEIEVEISKILASIGVSHTTMAPNIEYYYPIKFYWFSEGIYVINTTKEYEKALYSKLLKINGNEIDEIVNSVTSVISTDNDEWLKYQVPKYLEYSDILYGLGITDNKKSTVFTFENSEGEVFDLMVEAFNDGTKVTGIMEDSIDKAVPIHYNDIFFNKSDEILYAVTPLISKNTFYFIYSNDYDFDRQGYEKLVNEIFDYIDNNNIDKLVLDFRASSGGNTDVFYPFISELRKREELNKEGKFFVLYGRQTYSARLYNIVELKDGTNALYIGEPTGGKPNHYGDVRKFELKNSHITIFYATDFNKYLIEGDPDSFIPDVSIEYSIEDYINGVDPAMEYIFSQY